MSMLWHCWLGGRKGIRPVRNRGWWRWALVGPDGVALSRMVSVSASVNLALHHKVQKFSSGTGSPGWSRKKGRKMVVVVVLIDRLILVGVASYGALGHVPPLTSNNFFSVNFRAAQSDSYFMWLPLQTYLYSATAAAVVQSRLHERSCSLFTVLFHHILCATKSFVPHPPPSLHILVMTLLILALSRTHRPTVIMMMTANL